jgi:hypothetical protein
LLCRRGGQPLPHLTVPIQFQPACEGCQIPQAAPRSLPDPAGNLLDVGDALLTIGPVLLGASLAITATLQSSSAVVWARAHVPLFGLSSQLAPIALTSLAFSAMYLILPSARVRWTAALTGGVVAAVVFELAKVLYTVYTARILAHNPLYGSLAALPLFFIWLNYSWRIVLFGADVAHAVQYVSIDPELVKHLSLPTTAGAYVQILDQNGDPTGEDAVRPSSPAAAAGVKTGDIVTSINGQTIDAVHPLDAILTQFAPGDKITLEVIRGTEHKTLTVTLGTRPKDLG